MCHHQFVSVLLCKPLGMVRENPLSIIFFRIDFTGLRTVNAPVELMRKFIEIASPSTHQNRETCGILAGKLVSIECNHKEGFSTGA